MNLPTSYDPKAIEPAIARRWEKARCFHADPNPQPPAPGSQAPAPGTYSIVIPPPNVTGALHMGHAMDNLPQDICIRYHRMRGDNTCWLPGTDHAGIATQAIVERLLLEKEGKTRHDLGREALVQRIWDWKEKFGGRILQQLRALGCSSDWDRTRFTMDETCSKAVREAFFRLFNDGLIYRGKRLVNWDCHLQTAVSDDEIEQVDRKSDFYHLRYPILADQAPAPGPFPPYVIIATTRPESMLGDTAVAVHPEPRRELERREHELLKELESAGDKEKKEIQVRLDSLRKRRDEMLPLLEHLANLVQQGAKLVLPLVGRVIPLIADHHADPEKGTGAVKITPAHDANDYLVGLRHNLPMLNILNPDGTINAVGQTEAGKDFQGEQFTYVGLDRFAARKKIVADLERLGLLEKIEQINNTLPLSDRSKTPIEPYLSEQWFVKMGDEAHLGPDLLAEYIPRSVTQPHEPRGLAQLSIDAVLSGQVMFYPERYEKTYFDWLREKRDWCISRQLWWGHRIPVWSKIFNQAPEDFSASDNASLAITGLFGTVDRDAVAFQSAPTPDGRTVLHVCVRGHEPAMEALLEKAGFVRDPDVLDTWFSSALWPLSTLGWPEETPELKTWYPTNVLICGRGIITLWVARMVMFGLYLRHQVPFRHIHVHANILDGEGVTMSKSKGNGIDPIDLIERFGTDGLRYTLADLMTGTQDIRLPVVMICPHCQHEFPNPTGKKEVVACPSKACGKMMTRPVGIAVGTPEAPLAQVSSEKFDLGRNFTNKFWNAGRFVLLSLSSSTTAGSAQPLLNPDPIMGQTPEQFSQAVTSAAGPATDQAATPIEDLWIVSRLQAAIRTVSAKIEAYEFAGAIDAFRTFFWGEFCDWYLELVKPRLAAGADGAGSSPAAGCDPRPVLAEVFDQSLRLLHPFCPYITEELFARLNELEGGPEPEDQLLANAEWPTFDPDLVNQEAEQQVGLAIALTKAVREVRASQNIPPSKKLDVVLARGSETLTPVQCAGYPPFIARMGPAGQVRLDPSAVKPADAAVALAGGITLYVLGAVDPKAERARLEKLAGDTEKRVAMLRGRLEKPGYAEKAPPKQVAETRAQLQTATEELARLKASLAEVG